VRRASESRSQAVDRPAGDRPIRSSSPPDNGGVKALPISPPQPAPPSTTRPALHLVEAGRPEKADHLQQRRAFDARCHEVARWLANTERFEDRVQLYQMGVFTPRELSTAAALYPDLMPVLNGEWEWIAYNLADFDDD
jgi:hypothetical protein